MVENKNYFEDFEKIFKFSECQDIPDSKLPAILTWLSREPTNLHIVLKCNKHFFKMNKDIMKYALHFGINKNRKFIKGKSKEEDERIDVLAEYYKGVFTKREILNDNALLGQLDDESFRNEIANKLALTKKERSDFGAEWNAPKVVFDDKKGKQIIGKLGGYL